MARRRRGLSIAPAAPLERAIVIAAKVKRVETVKKKGKRADGRTRIPITRRDGICSVVCDNALKCPIAIIAGDDVIMPLQGHGAIWKDVAYFGAPRAGIAATIGKVLARARAAPFLRAVPISINAIASADKIQFHRAAVAADAPSAD